MNTNGLSKKDENGVGSLPSISHRHSTWFSYAAPASNETYLRSVEDSRHGQHGHDDEDVSTAAHVARHNQHFGEGRVEGELYHQTPRWRQSTWKYTREHNYKVIPREGSRSTWDVKNVGGTSATRAASFPAKARCCDGEAAIMWHLFVYHPERGGWTADSWECL